MGKITVKHYLNKKLKPEIDGKNLYYPVYISIIVNSKNIQRKSHICDVVSEKEFEKKGKTLTGNNLRSLIDYEQEIYTRTIKILLKDIEENSVKKEFLYISLKGYNSKDDFINLLNAYIDFYTDSIFGVIWNYCNEKIENEIYNKLANVFSLKNQEEAKKFFYYKNPVQEAEFVLKNLSVDSIELLILRERLKSFLAPYNIKTGYDIPYIDWIDNKIQNELSNFLRTYKRKSEYYLPENFTFNSEIINKYISIIDSVIYSNNYTELVKNTYNINI
ncbi:MAG: hypothetical protein PHR83_08035 [Paludibacter sp.]|nr:hypothetical protein [Paludibacter sp.]